jgi:hypothetical protein
MKHISSYSGGAASWYTSELLAEKYGKENVINLFADTLIEDEDTYRFIDETTEKSGIELVRVVDGRDPWEVFHDLKWIGNSRIAQCSHWLKQKVCRDWVEANYKPDECIIYVGIDWSEIHRMPKIEEYLGRDDVSILTKSIFSHYETTENEIGDVKRIAKYKKIPYTLYELRMDYENQPDQIDMFDLGGCGCYLDD